MKKLALDERVKHRLTGVLVIVSIAIIFLPAMLKRSNQHLNEHVNVSVKLPPKPVLPNVAMVQEKAIFSEVKVAEVNIPTVAAAPPSSKLVQVAFQDMPKSVVVSKVAGPTTVNNMPAKVSLSHKLAANLKATLPTHSKVPTQKEMYAVQLAAFNQEQNAVALVSRLRSKGYAAKYNKQGVMYKVVVSSLGSRDNARVLQKKLADSLQMTGLIIRAQVS